MSFTNVETEYINWQPVPTGGLRSKGPLHNVNVADGAGGWQQSTASIATALGQTTLSGVDNVSNVGRGHVLALKSDTYINTYSSAGVQANNITNAGHRQPITVSSDSDVDISATTGITLPINTTGIENPAILHTYMVVVDSGQFNWVDTADMTTVQGSSFFSLTKIGRVVTLYIYAISGVSSPSATSYLGGDYVVPTNCQPDGGTPFRQPIQLNVNSAYFATGAFQWSNTTNFSLVNYASPTLSFGGSATLGALAFSVSWYAADN